MNLDFSDNQKMLRDQTRKFLENNCPLSEVRRIFSDDDASYSEKLWQGLSKLGVMGSAIPENYGGVGLGMLELCVVAEELGRVLAPVPFSSSIYLAAEAIRIAGSKEQKEKVLAGLASGKMIGTFAYAEGNGAPSAHNIKTHFDGKNLNGKKIPVANGLVASIAVVVAKTSSGVALVLAEMDNVQREPVKVPVKVIDPTCEHAQMMFNNQPAEILSGGDFDDGEALLNHVLDRAAVLYAFEQLGGADSCLEFARDYANERYAFGRPIGSFQAIKHKLADAYVQNQIARSNCYYAAMVLENNDSDLPAAAAAARLAASDAFIYVAQENIQTHGGIGFTWESDSQFFYRRAKQLALAIGGKGRWEERLVVALEKRNVA